ncbi:hypothetical protein [Tenacibaculum jejuense]|uniref:Alpha-ketoglutarate decarboxylase n=1 Tax=Tenacibaculum jejuense TaxID=584609 RepID=A0A238UAW9_9FLAO|nr:hypothetical protein [Tenacibaculum jejuense]SNR15560.1 Protein of unknown function precursor, putative sensor of anti-sigma and ECF sigma factor [Tenacibaculum jejuense]
MKKFIFLFTLLTCSIIFSQESDTNFWENVQFGGSFGLGFGNNSTTIAIAPSAIYNFNPSFALGLGAGYQYAKRGDFKNNVFSSSLLSFYNPIPEVQISAEFEQLFVNRTLGNIKDNFSYPALYLGAAYRVGRNISIGFRYDVLFDENQSIYGSAISPVFRVFF